MTLCREAPAGSITHPGRAVAPGTAGSRRSSLGLPGVAGSLSGLSFCHYHLGDADVPSRPVLCSHNHPHLFPIGLNEVISESPGALGCLPGPFHFPYSNPKQSHFLSCGASELPMYIACTFLIFQPDRASGVRVSFPFTSPMMLVLGS